MIDIYNLDKFRIDDFVKDFFIGFYQALFMQNKSEFQYDPDKELTKLNIADQFSVDDLTPEFKPTIYIRRRPFSFMGTSIDQFMGGNLLTGSKLYSDLIAGTLEVVCVSRVGLEASRLAGLVFLLTNEFKNELCKNTGMHQVSVKTLGEEQPTDVRSTMRIVEVPVLIQVVFQYTWAVEKMNLVPLKEIEIGKSSNPVTGEELVGIPNTGCNGGTGVDVGDVDGLGSDDGEVKICIPITSESPNRPE